MFVFSKRTYAQLDETLPIHSHPDSMYAKVTVVVVFSQFRITEYSTTKLHCNNCDILTISYIKQSAINYAKSRETSLKLQFPMKDVSLNLPITLSLPKRREQE